METKLTVAMSRSDRTQTILSGQQLLPPYTLEPQKASIEEIFVRQAGDNPYDIAEMSLASNLINLSRGENRLTAIPVFLSRAFRHNSIFVRSDSPWTHPSELKNRRFGFPEFQMTAAVWVRAMFRHEWGIGNDEMQWFTYRPERVPIQTPAQPGKSEDIFKALVDGEVDAIMSVRRPPEQYFPASGEGGVIRRLIPDVWQAEREYYGKTGIFPIMHFVSVKQETAQRHPELPKQLYDLMLGHKNEAVAQMFETIKNQTSNPFLWESLESSAALMKDGDVWPYGLKANRGQIETFIDYLLEDGLLTRKVAIEEMFHESVLNT